MTTEEGSMEGETYDALRAAVSEGLVEVVGNGARNGNGRLRLRVTEAGAEKVEGIVASAIEGYGGRAAEALALVLGLPRDVAEGLVAMREGLSDEA